MQSLVKNAFCRCSCAAAAASASAAVAVVFFCCCSSLPRCYSLLLLLLCSGFCSWCRSCSYPCCWCYCCAADAAALILAPAPMLLLKCTGPLFVASLLLLARCLLAACSLLGCLSLLLLCSGCCSCSCSWYCCCSCCYFFAGCSCWCAPQSHTIYPRLSVGTLWDVRADPCAEECSALAGHEKSRAVRRRIVVGVTAPAARTS
jgi:hypothetical protein